MRNASEHVTLGEVFVAVGCGLVVSMLSGCSWGFLSGESGIEYSFRINPITQTEAEQKFESRTYRFGRSRSNQQLENLK